MPQKFGQHSIGFGWRKEWREAPTDLELVEKRHRLFVSRSEAMTIKASFQQVDGALDE
jgi:hypothetical protein